MEYLDFSYNKEIGYEVEFFTALGQLEKINDSQLEKISNLSFTDCNLKAESLQLFAAQMNLKRFKNLRSIDVAKNENVGLELSF